MIFFKKNWPYFVLAFILLIGLFFRIYGLQETTILTDEESITFSQVPPGIYPDEAKNANDAIETLTTGEYKIFYPENNGREGLWIWLIALSFKYFGISIFSLKIVGATAGILSILGAYLLTKEFFRFSHQYRISGEIESARITQETISLFVAGLMATSFWHINFSRIAFRAILVPLLLSFGLYFTLRALRTKKLLYSIIAGVTWGLGMYTYIAFRLAPAIPIFVILFSFSIYLWHSKPRLALNYSGFKRVFIKDEWWKLAMMGVAAVVTAFPLFLFFVRNPETFGSRSAGISVFATDNFLLAFFQSLGVHLQMLVFQGDMNWRHNFSGQPELFWPVGLLFILGAFYSGECIIKSWRKKNWQTLTAHFALLSSFGVMILPAALTTEGIPHALRAIGLMPFVFIYAGLGFLFIIRIIFPHKRHRSEIWIYALGVAIIIIMLFTSYQYVNYFVNWGRNTEVEGAFSRPDLKIGEYFNEIPKDVDKYLIVNRGGVLVSYPESVILDASTEALLPMSAQTVLFIQQTKQVPPQNTKYILPDEIPENISNVSVFIPLEASENIKEKLRKTYPGGLEAEFEYFWVYHVAF